ncbi:hypothetical protein Avbf_09517 [Armadillidium vulgare]|nr:hypothetical protein Avbf_09517 [Armadillidium vulgare]
MLFRWWENWETHEGIYFSFITLSTIGFGDYVPGNSFATEDDDNDAFFISSMKMIATIAYCVFDYTKKNSTKYNYCKISTVYHCFGLSFQYLNFPSGMALLSMAINLMQQQIVTKTKWLGKQIGISGEPEDDSWKYKNLKKHEPGTVFETPPDRDGNQPTMKRKPKEEKRQNQIQAA